MCTYYLQGLEIAPIVAVKEVVKKAKTTQMINIYNVKKLMFMDIFTMVFHDDYSSLRRIQEVFTPIILCIQNATRVQG